MVTKGCPMDFPDQAMNYVAPLHESEGPDRESFYRINYLNSFHDLILKNPFCPVGQFFRSLLSLKIANGYTNKKLSKRFSLPTNKSCRPLSGL